MMEIESPIALVWCDPVERGDLKLAPGDVKDAIRWFTEKAGQPPRQIFLCPKNENFSNEIPEDIKVVCQTGVMLWEIQLTISEHFSPIPAEDYKTTLRDVDKYLGVEKATIPATHVLILATPKPKITEQQKPLKTVTPPKTKTLRVAKIKSKPQKFRKKKKETRGRKKLKLPGRRIMSMHSAGMGAKSIANKLKDKYHFEVSFRTVARYINEHQARLI